MTIAGDTIGSGRYPALASKFDLLEILYHAMRDDRSGSLQELYFRIGNTDLSGVSNAANDIADFEAARIQG